MLNFDELLKPSISTEWLLNRISEEDIYRRYSSVFPAKSTRSPFRKDSNASFGFFKTASGWLWKDLGTGEKGGVFQYVFRELNKQYTLTFKEVLQKIAEDFNIQPDYVSLPTFQKRKSSKSVESAISRIEKPKKLLQVRNRKWKASDLDYWMQYGITIEILKEYNVGVCSDVYLNGKLFWEESPGNPIFYYFFPHSGNLKIYRPLEINKDAKWLSNVNNMTDIQGYHQCQIKRCSSQKIILTKSMKEVMFLRTFHVPAMAIHGENHDFHPDFIRHLKKYCLSLRSLYDRDRPGLHAAWHLRKVHGVPATIIPHRLDINNPKDLTDLWIKDPYSVYPIIEILKKR
jgi:hypothetical protein